MHINVSGAGPDTSNTIEGYAMGLVDRTPWSENDIRALDNGNAILKATLSIVLLMVSLRIPFIWENPRSSRLWWIPEVMRIMEHPLCCFITTDFCCWERGGRSLLDY